MAQRQPKALMVPTSAKSEAAIIVGYDGELYAWNEAGDETPLTGGTVGTSLGKLANELRNEIVGTEGTVRFLKGFSTEGDGGGGQFEWSNTPAVDDGGTAFNVVGLGSNMPGWRRVYSGPIDVRWFGADNTGATDTTVAIRRALAACVAAGGGEVLVPRGTYKTSDYLNITSNITLRGQGRKATRIVLTVSGNAIGLNVGADQTDFGIRDLTIAASVTGATTQTTGLNLAATSGHEILRGHIDNVGVESFTFAGLFTTYVRDLTIGTLYVNDQKVCSDGGGGVLGGVPVWFFKGTQRVSAGVIAINGSDSDGVFVDAGTTGAGGDAPDSITIGTLNVHDWNRSSQATGAVFGVQGASNISVGVVSGTLGNPAVIAMGITIEQDQNGQIPQHIQIGQALLENFGGYPVIMRGAQRCTIGHLRVKDGLQKVQGFGVGYIVRFEPPNYLGNGLDAGDTTDNFVGSVEVEIGAGANARYDYGALFQGALVTHPDLSTTPSNCLRNRIASARWGTGAASTLDPTAVYNVATSGGCVAPVTGANANVIQGYDIDHRTPLIQGMPVKIDVPGIGYGQFGPQTVDYCHMITDRNGFFFSKPSAAVVTSYFNGPTVTYPASGNVPQHGTATHDFASDADWTVPYTDYYAELLQFTDLGTVLSTGRNVVLPLTAGATWDILNLTAQTLTFKGVTGTGIAVTAGSKARIFTDGVNFY